MRPFDGIVHPAGLAWRNPVPVYEDADRRRVLGHALLMAEEDGRISGAGSIDLRVGTYALDAMIDDGTVVGYRLDGDGDYEISVGRDHVDDKVDGLLRAGARAAYGYPTPEED